MHRAPRLRSVAVVGLCLAVGACTTGPEEGSYFIRCPDALRVRITPDSARLVVGDSLVVQARFGQQAGCAPPAPEGADRWRWRSGDTLIATVDSVRGVVRARRPGATHLRANHAQSTIFADSIVLRVVSP